MKTLRKIVIGLAFLLCLLLSAGRYGSCEAAIDCFRAGQYSTKPLSVTNAARPNILILFSNDESSFRAGHISITYDDAREYYGYFDPRKEYTYSNGYFVPAGYVDYKHNHRHTSATRWSGNFLNWLTMCHADFTRKVMTGGRRFLDSSEDTILERGDIPDDPASENTHIWSKTVSDASPFTPYSGMQTFSNVGITFFRDPDGSKSPGKGKDSYNVRVQVCRDSSTAEDVCFYYENAGVWKPQGLLQSFRDKANFGLMSYSAANSAQGGVVRVNIHDMSEEIGPAGTIVKTSSGLINFVNSYAEVAWDPLGELYYEAIRYFKGLKPTETYCVDSPDSGFPVICNHGGNNWVDPVTSSCQKNFIIIINDEYPSRDSDALPGSEWPATISDPESTINVGSLTQTIGNLEGISGTRQQVGSTVSTVNHEGNCDSPLTIGNLGEVRGICPNEGSSQGTFYAGGLAYYASTRDLRDDFAGTQTITTYVIASRSTSDSKGYRVPVPPMSPLYLAAKYGGFDDQNGNLRPDPGEWEGEAEQNCTPYGPENPLWNCHWPKNFAHAEEGKDFDNALSGFLTDILKRTVSGTAASVMTSSENGEGQLYQAYSESSRTDGAGEVTWIGFLQSLWIDASGNLREDTNQDGRLVLTEDNIVKLRFDSATNTTVVDKYKDSNGNDTPDADECNPSSPNYAGCRTASIQQSQPLSSLKPIWEAGYTLGRKTPEERNIKTFADKNLDGAVDSNEFIDFASVHKDPLAPLLNVDPTDVDNLIEYIRGTEITGWRNRSLGSQKFLLGDIVHSSPTPVSRPMDNYDVIYGDKTYLAYFTRYKDRPTYVYVGANDGMLHAFYGGVFHPAGYTQPAYVEVESGRSLGQEVWAYIPNNLLPHLKWLACPEYSHVYYVDLKPKVVDARIFQSEWDRADGVHPYGWGTILICGMGYGGAPITVRAGFDGGQAATRSFKSAYFAIDITDPANPQLLWEKKFDRAGYSLSYPAVTRIQNGSAAPGDVAFSDQKWLLILGNGPADYNGNPDGENGEVYIVNLASGNLERDIPTSGSAANASEFMASAAVVDLNLNYDGDVAYIGSTIQNGAGSYGGKMYRISFDRSDGSPDWNINNWRLSTLFDAGRPITAAPATSQSGLSEKDRKVWVYFGTGRYLGLNDKTTTDPQAFYGIQDPCSMEFGSCSQEAASLVDVTGVNVYETGYATGPNIDNGTPWTSLIEMIKSKDGFLLSLDQPVSHQPAERVLSKPAVIGGLVIFPSFRPDKDVCAFSGDARLYSIYYRTGTAYRDNTVGVDSKDTRIGANHVVLRKVRRSVDLGPGLPSQISIHVGREEGGKAITQMSTGAVADVDFKAPEKNKSGFIYWKELE